MLFADYDVDGTTGASIMVKTLELIGGEIICYFPKRSTEGYGLNKKGIDFAKRENIGLIITIDCGISANEEVDYAGKQGIDVIIIDHHEQVGPLPKAVAIIDPKQKGCNYPYKNLAAVGVAFKVVQVLIKAYALKLDITSFLDLVCLGTIADLVPLNGENRIIVKNGLEQLMKTKNIGLKALVKVSGLERREINSGHISFRLAPRINATGRLNRADMVLELFQTNSEKRAEKIAYILDEQNIHRQEIQEKILQKALSKIEKEVDIDKEACIVLAEKGWHRGVIGIVASRIVEIYHRPTILISIEKGIGYGSGRSIPKFHLLKSVDSCKKLLARYGGHNQAVGITINEGNIKKFKENINKYAKDKLKQEDFIPSLNLDAKLSLSDIDFEMIKELNKLPPFGVGNPKPIFYSTDLYLADSPRILKEEHIKMNLCDQAKVMDAIGFRMAHFLDEITQNAEKIHVAYLPELNEWNGNTTMQLHLKDIKFSDELHGKID